MIDSSILFSNTRKRYLHIVLNYESGDRQILLTQAVYDKHISSLTKIYKFIREEFIRLEDKENQHYLTPYERKVFSKLWSFAGDIRTIKEGFQRVNSQKKEEEIMKEKVRIVLALYDAIGQRNKQRKKGII